MASRFCTANNCDRPTDHTTRSVITGRIYVRSTAMQITNNNIHCEPQKAANIVLSLTFVKY